MGVKIVAFFSVFACNPSFALAPPVKPKINRELTNNGGFIENKGHFMDQNNQYNPDVLYLLNTPGMNVQLRKGGFSYDFYEMTNPNDAVPHYSFHRVDIDFVNSNPQCYIGTCEPNTALSNYYCTRLGEQAVTQVRSFQEVVYRNIYPGVDIEFQVDDQTGFKYNLVVHHNSGIKDIRMKITGPDHQYVSDGSVMMTTRFGEVIETIPVSYYLDTDGLVRAQVQFIQLENYEYGFQIKHTDKLSEGIWIDPVPIRLWGTYYGGADFDQPTTMQVDPGGNIIIAGFTSSLTNIATTGSFQSTYAGNVDGFLAKFSSDGDLIWGTYFGGTALDNVSGCSVSSSGQIYLTGETYSVTGISSSGAYQGALNGISDAFLCQFSSDGSRTWSTYYGGSAADGGKCCVVNDGYIYVGGNTESSDVIASGGAFQPLPGGAQDGFLAKFDSQGQRIWGTYYGGTMLDNITSISVTGEELFFCGQTASSDNISTPGAHQPLFAGGVFDGFFVCFDTSGQRSWGTYYGGSAYDGINACLPAPPNVIYIVGSTSSLNNISTSGSHQQAYGGGGYDGFIVQFDNSGTRNWGTYYGGSAIDRLYAGAIDDSNFFFASGGTYSMENISTPNAYMFNLQGNSDALLIKFDTGGHRLWGTYYGSVDGESALSVCAYGEHQYISGITFSADNISTPGSNQPNYGGSGDGYLVKFSDCPVPDSAMQITGIQSLCVNSTLVLYSVPSIPYATSYTWSVPTGANIISGQNTDSIMVDFSISATSGYVSVKGINSCGVGDSSSIFVTVNSLPVPFILGNDTGCLQDVGTYTTLAGQSDYLWSVSSGGMFVSGGGTGDNSVSVLWTAPGLQWVSVIFTDTNGCTALNPTVKSIDVSSGFIASVTIAASSNNICQGTPVTFNAIPINGGTSPSYQWQVNGVNAGTNSPVFTYIPASLDLVSCILTSSLTTCITNNPDTSNVITMTVNPNLPVSVSVTPSANPFCIGTPITFTATPVNGGITPIYQWQVNGINVGSNNPVFTYIPASLDLVSCILTSSLPDCLTNNPDTSAVISMIGFPGLPADVTIAASPSPSCQGIPVTFTATPINGGSNPSFQWQVNGMNVGTNSPVYTYIPAIMDLVSCIMTSNLACVTNNPASSIQYPVSISPAPVVTFTPCFDTITTTNAKPIKLKGGIPLGGTYSGPGVVAGYFYPNLAGVGTHIIKYTYTNVALCSDSTSSRIHEFTSPLFNCGNNLIDVRDGKIYATIQIGGQCWMAADLNFGIEIPPNIHQRDNCISENYRTVVGGRQTAVYQWDEMMIYDNTPALQGICPPNWHLPTEIEWGVLFSNWTNNAFAASPLKYSGYSGFNAVLSGVRHQTVQWDYQNFATFYWSSTAYGPYKAWAHGMNDPDPSVSYYPSLRSNAFSVRCLRD